MPVNRSLSPLNTPGERWCVTITSFSEIFVDIVSRSVAYIAWFCSLMRYVSIQQRISKHNLTAFFIRITWRTIAFEKTLPRTLLLKYNSFQNWAPSVKNEWSFIMFNYLRDSLFHRYIFLPLHSCHLQFFLSFFFFNSYLDPSLLIYLIRTKSVRRKVVAHNIILDTGGSAIFNLIIMYQVFFFDKSLLCQTYLFVSST